MIWEYSLNTASCEPTISYNSTMSINHFTQSYFPYLPLRKKLDSYQMSVLVIQSIKEVFDVHVGIIEAHRETVDTE